MSRNVRQRKKLVQTAIILGLLSGIGTINADAVVPSEGITISQQKEIVVKGTVKDKTGETIPGANIVVKGTNAGTTTDYDGNFSLQVPANAILEVSFIGYKTADVAVNNQNNINVVLSSTVEELDEVVVTALGIRREKKALGYAMQEIKTESMAEIRSESVANMLQGKVAGVQISQSATGVGGSTRVVLRGTTSLSGNNQPLWVVDGMPISDNQTDKAGQWGGIDYSGAAAEINPEDIESISVLKGANAAAMYGSRAQNGVIIVTTKKGKSGKLQLEYNGNIHFSKAYDSYEYQNIYGQGSGGTFTVGATESWGPKMTGQMIDNWRGANGIYKDSRYDTQYAFLPQDNYVEEFYRTGVNYTNTLTASGGSDNLTSRFSFSDSRNQGITPNHSLNKQYYDLSSEFKSKYLDINAKINFMRQKGNNRPALGEYGIMKSLITLPRGIRLSDLRNPVGLDGYTVNWTGQSNEFRNPFTDTMTENGNQDERNRLIGKVQLTGKITDYLRVTGRVGIDWYHDQIRNYGSYTQTYTSTSYSHTMATNQEFNADLMLNFDKQFGDFSVIANLGTATTSFKWNNVSGSSGYFSIPHLIALGNGNNQTTSEGYSKKRVNSILGNATIGWKSRIYLDVTARNDWSSTLPSNNWSYFYPSVSLSGILSEMIKLPEQITYWKIRGSFAKVGNDTNPYRLLSVYTLDKTNGDILNATASTTFPLTNLKPEDTRSYEVGTEYRMFNGRLGLDFTYYNANTINQILTVKVPISSGYSSKLINAGKMKSYGLEVSLTGTPIQTKDWTWDVTLNWGLNRTECVELDPNLKRFVIGETRIGKVVVDEGGRYGDIVGIGYKRDANGRVLIGDNGLPITESEKVLGNMTPDWTGSFSTSLRWKNLSLNALIDVRCGGDLISTTDLYASSAGASKRTLAGREEGMVVNGIVESTGQENTKTVSAQSYWSAIGGAYGVAEEFMYDASYVKFRELSIGYTLPKAWLKDLPIQSVKLSAVGRDLFYIFKNAPVTPEASFSREDYAQAFEYAALPSTRSFGFTLNVKF
ncbi:SusC/RagA family TonB-linked outer membrane protein [Parabacteroides bouchesdurhonensis]|uniref:SusC/RagA family TonB-linked outer membrane protein n=1 Tax=Parabacteroides bouchesdurhonensis TaxID=1936995 RepID=UPI000C83C075|nr:SusC/RagA family TonB-linked outer membrane protein [Parabacteroides bouchesdurhonensis]